MRTANKITTLLQREYLHSLFGWKIGFKSLIKHTKKKHIKYVLVFSKYFSLCILLVACFMMDALSCSFDPLSMLMFLFLLSFWATSTLHNVKLIFNEKKFFQKEDATFWDNLSWLGLPEIITFTFYFVYRCWLKWC